MVYYGEQSFVPRRRRMSEEDPMADAMYSREMARVIGERGEDGLDINQNVGNIKQLSGASANVAGMKSIPEPEIPQGSTFTPEAAAASMPAFDPVTMGAKVALMAIQQEQARRARNIQAERKAQVDHSDNMRSSMRNMANLATIIGIA